ncbi:MAG: pyruvate kinase [gamma proteobacterium endosymbiont of Trioza apicalis]
MYKKLRRTKIIATLGPSTDYNNNLKKIIIAGVNLIRLNFSHGNTKDHFLRAEKIRKISSNLGLNIGIIGDLQGPKIRISCFKKNKIFLNKNDEFILDTSLGYRDGDRKKIGVNYKNLTKDVKYGDILLLDDGKIKLNIIKIKNTRIYTKVINGGFLSNNKGINKFKGGLSAKFLTKKDKKDIITAAKIKVDYLAVSFPRNSDDLNYARKLIYNAGNNAKIISKIERAEIVNKNKNINNIILASDAVMIARGDLGVEIGDSEIISIQKKIIKKTQNLNRPVIVATQMMESMINNTEPTRAEIMDVANAVLDGTDAVMLSAETAIGSYPIKTVIKTSQACIGAEKMFCMNTSKYRINKKFNSIEETIAITTMYAANHIKNIDGIITLTNSNYNSLIMSRINSWLPIFYFSNNLNKLTLTTLYRGVKPIYYKKIKKNKNIIINSINFLKKTNFLKKNNNIIIVINNKINSIKSNNTIHILKVK